MSFAPFLALSWWLGFRIGFGWLVQELPPEQENLHRARRDKNPGRPQWPGIGMSLVYANSKVCEP